MQRIVIIGCSGAGKSTLARELGRRLDLPVTHLDALYWQPGWKPPQDIESFKESAREATRGTSWIIDGGFTTGTIEARLASADTVLVMDLPAWLCLWRAIARVVKDHGKTRADLAPGCFEQFDPALWHDILTWRRRKLPKLERDLANHFKGRLIRLRTPAEVRTFLGSLAAPA